MTKYHRLPRELQRREELCFKLCLQFLIAFAILDLAQRNTLGCSTKLHRLLAVLTLCIIWLMGYVSASYDCICKMLFGYYFINLSANPLIFPLNPCPPSSCIGC